MGTLQSLALAFVMEHNPSALNIGFDMNLLASAYAVRPLFHHATFTNNKKISLQKY
jgi:hypothetical protein